MVSMEIYQPLGIMGSSHPSILFPFSNHGAPHDREERDVQESRFFSL